MSGNFKKLLLSQGILNVNITFLCISEFYCDTLFIKFSAFPCTCFKQSKFRLATELQNFEGQHSVFGVYLILLSSSSSGSSSSSSSLGVCLMGKFKIGNNWGLNHILFIYHHDISLGKLTSLQCTFFCMGHLPKKEAVGYINIFYLYYLEHSIHNLPFEH